MKKILRTLFAATLLGAATSFGQGVILWDESLNGELSQDFTHPTSLTPLVAGTNSLIGAAEIVPFGNGWIGSGDYFTTAVPSNLVVAAVYLTIDEPNVWAWIGDPAYSSRLGWAQNPTNGDLLVQWGLASLEPSIYGMYIENNDAQPVPSIANYRLDFVAQPTPEPSIVCLTLAGAALMWLRSRTRKVP